MQALSAVMLAVVALKQPAIEFYTLCFSHGMNEVTLSYCYTGDYPAKPLLGKKNVSGRLSMPGGESPRHAQNPLLGE